MGITDSSTMSANEIKLFDKYPFDEVTVSDMALTDYIAVKTSDACYIPHSAGRWQKVKFKKAQCPLMERLTCCLMKHGRNSGKKVKAVRIIRHTCAIMHLLTNENPLQVHSIHPTYLIALVSIPPCHILLSCLQATLLFHSSFSCLSFVCSAMKCTLHSSPRVAQISQSNNVKLHDSLSHSS